MKNASNAKRRYPFWTRVLDIEVRADRNLGHNETDEAIRLARKAGVNHIRVRTTAFPFRCFYVLEA
jgi:biopolymer transport protein ExbD